MKKELHEAAKINKPLLQWLTPQELVNIDLSEMSEEEIKDRAKMAADLWERHFEKKLKVMITAELLQIKTVETEMQLMWLRGILAGFDIIRQFFLEQINISSSREEENNNNE